MKNNTRQLYTNLYNETDDGAWDVYPRPSLIRDRWLNLNGTWEFTGQGREDKAFITGNIRVPFCPESLLSGVDHVFMHAKLRYRRTFQVPQEWKGLRVLLHFGAVDQVCRVYVNGSEAGRHTGGYTAFTLDITDLVREGANELTVHVVDNLDETLPYGKQTYKRGGMWYTPVSGIWQSVWLEAVPDTYVKSIDFKVIDDGVELMFDGVTDGVVKLDNGEEFLVTDGKTTVKPSEVHFWSPEEPYLYRYTATFNQDTVSSYFAIRTLSVMQDGAYKRLCLNGRPYFFHGLLDQGYYPEGIYTPASPKAYEQDILDMKNLGFNTLRKHIKVEPDVFYYDCDRLGMIVFQDMVNNGKYAYVFDTVMPTVGVQKLDDTTWEKRERVRAAFRQGMADTVKQLHFHPCICYWTIFNEGWGQFDADNLYLELKSMDDTRFIDTTSGWFRRKLSDVESLHIYFKKLYVEKSDKPVILTEFGGYSLKIADHSYNCCQTYGYRTYTDRETFVEGVRQTYLEEIIPLISQGLCGAIYTQVSDVEDEVNGLMTYDRQVAKILPEEMTDIAKLLQEEIEK